MKNENEKLFKKTAITFASEAISSDIKSILQEKKEYNLAVLKEFNDMLKSISQSKDRKVRHILENKHFILNSLETALKDYESILGAYNLIIMKLFKEKNIIEEELNSEDLS